MPPTKLPGINACTGVMVVASENSNPEALLTLRLTTDGANGGREQVFAHWTPQRPVSANASAGGAHVLDLEKRTIVAWTDTNGWLARTLAPARRKGGGR